MWPLTKRVFTEFFKDRIPTVAGGITFFTLLALFPAVGAIVSIYGLFADRGDVAKLLSTFSGFLPEGAISVLGAELRRIVQKPPTSLGTGFTVSLAIALWSASGGYKALVDGLNVAFEVQESRSIFRVSFNALIFTAAAIMLAIVLVVSSVGIPAALSDNDPRLLKMYEVLVWPIATLTCAFGIGVVYRIGPNQPVGTTRWLTWGSCVASILWLLSTVGFTWYAQNYGTYNNVYGQLGALVGFLTWVWLSVMIILLGAEVDSEVGRIRQ